MESINSISSVGSSVKPVLPGIIGGGAEPGKGAIFNNVLSQMIDQTNNNLVQSDETVKNFVKGNIDNPHEVMIQLEEAHLALQFTIQMRNKVVEAYQELMRMQL